MITIPPLNSNIPVSDDKGQKLGMAIWPKPWANFMTAVWTQLANLLSAPAKTVAANYTATLTDGVILINGNITVTLPVCAKAIGKRITVKIINAGGGTRTVSGNGVNIDGSANWTSTTQYASAEFVTNETGTAWSIV